MYPKKKLSNTNHPRKRYPYLLRNVRIDCVSQVCPRKASINKVTELGYFKRRSQKWIRNWSVYLTKEFIQEQIIRIKKSSQVLAEECSDNNQGGFERSCLFVC